MARQPRRPCVICGERRVLDDTGWCTACYEQEEFGQKLQEDEDPTCSACDGECSGHAGGY